MQAAPPAASKVLLIEDNPGDAELIRLALATGSDPAWDVRHVERLSEGLRALAAETFYTVLLDMGLPDSTGLDGVRAIAGQFPKVPIVVLTGHNELPLSVRAIEAGAQDYLVKGQAGPEAIVRSIVYATRRKALEVELREVNESLDAFNAIVSHDLRAPLNHVRTFVDLIEEETADALSPTATDYMKRVQGAVRRMQELIDDLLEFSRSAHAPLNLQPVDLVGVARSVIAEFHEREPARPYELVVPDQLRCRGDPGHLTIALQNLLNNAWKYSSRKPTVRIEVGSRETSRGLAFYVRDEGTGFDPGQVGRLFQPFSRLHSKAEFPGTGIGLATVRRIVERHGGTIWAEAKPGVGATFIFTLPSPVPAPSPSIRVAPAG